MSVEKGGENLILSKLSNLSQRVVENTEGILRSSDFAERNTGEMDAFFKKNLHID